MNIKIKTAQFVSSIMVGSVALLSLSILVGALIPTVQMTSSAHGQTATSISNAKSAWHMQPAIAHDNAAPNHAVAPKTNDAVDALEQKLPQGHAAEAIYVMPGARQHQAHGAMI